MSSKPSDRAIAEAFWKLQADSPLSAGTWNLVVERARELDATYAVHPSNEVVPALPAPKYLARLRANGEWLELLHSDDWSAEMWQHGTEDVYSANQLRAYARAYHAAQPAGEGARGKLGHVAAIAHNGGLAGLTEHQAIVAIRRLTISAWDKSGSEEQLRQRVDAAMKGGEEGNG